MIRWGIIGIGNIAMRFMRSLANSEEGYLYGAASLTQRKRENFHQQYPHVQVYESYEALLDDENIDAVYIATRHKDHYQWAKEALKRHKAVLCEKPATLSYHQTVELCDLAKQNQTLFIEAMKTRFVPLIQDIKALLEEGVIGEIERVETSFCYDIEYRQGHYLFDEDQGGILYDVGTYNIASTIDYIHSPLVSVQSDVEKNYQVDVYDQVELTFESGQTARLEMAMDRNKKKIMTIKGTLGTLTCEPFYRPTTALIIVENKEKTIQKDYIHDDFFTEIQEVHRCLKNQWIESPRMTFQDSKDCMMIMEKIKESFHD